MRRSNNSEESVLFAENQLKGMSLLRIPGLAISTVVSLGLSTLVQGQSSIDFNRDVRPIISDKCYQCHGPDADNQDSEFRLDSREAAIADLGDYFGIVPGNLEESDLHWRIWEDIEEDLMPPVD